MNDIIFILGIGVFGGILGAIIFQKLKIPQVLGYITVGIIFGESGFKIINSSIPLMETFSLFALGIIGFLVGGEIKTEMFKKYGKQILTILFAEGILSFFLVTVGISVFLFYLTSNLAVSIAAGIIFGAIASATDPASTIDVLWEYRSAGIVTTTIVAIIALDDALAMTLYALGTSISSIMLGNNISITHELLKVFIELSSAGLIGIIAGLIINFVLKFFYLKEKILVFTLGIILLVIGIAHTLNLDIILSTMFLGIFLTNTSPKRSEKIFQLMRSFSIPIYVLFFVLVGARLSFRTISMNVIIITLIYLVARNSGKLFGVMIGGHFTKSDKKVTKYAGFGIFAQGGVAIGLSIVASKHLNNITVIKDLKLSDLIVSVITATTFFAQIIGPAMVKFTSKITGEIDKNITEEDIILKWNVEDVLLKNEFAVINETAPLTNLLNMFKRFNNLIIPVIDYENKIKGTVSLENIKDLFITPETWQWIIVQDVLYPIDSIISKKNNLKETMNYMHQINVEQIPVVDDKKNMKFEGILDLRHIKHLLKNEIIKLKSSA